MNQDFTSEELDILQRGRDVDLPLHVRCDRHVSNFLDVYIARYHRFGDLGRRSELRQLLLQRAFLEDERRTCLFVAYFQDVRRRIAAYRAVGGVVSCKMTLQGGEPFPALERDIAFLHQQIAARNAEIIESLFNQENAYATFEMAADIYYYLAYVGLDVRAKRLAFQVPLITGKGLSEKRRADIKLSGDRNDFRSIVDTTPDCTTL